MERGRKRRRQRVLVASELTVLGPLPASGRERQELVVRASDEKPTDARAQEGQGLSLYKTVSARITALSSRAGT